GDSTSQVSAYAGGRSGTKHKKKADNTMLLVGGGVGGGVLLLATVIGLAVALSGGSDKPIAKVDTNPAKTTNSNKTPDQKDDDVGSLLERSRGPIQITTAKPLQ